MLRSAIYGEENVRLVRRDSMLISVTLEPSDIWQLQGIKLQMHSYSTRAKLEKIEEQIRYAWR